MNYPLLDEIQIVGFAGDWHGNVAHALRAVDAFRKEGVQIIFQQGDFGLYGSLLEFGGDKLRQRLQAKLAKNNQWLLVTFGNHENYDLVEKLPFVQEGIWKGFQREEKADRILYFTRGQSLSVGGRNFLSCGGAASIDVQWRLDYQKQKGARKIWWEQELITVEDMRKTVEEAKRLETVDVFLAHDVFASAEVFGSHRTDSNRWSVADLDFAQKTRDSLEHIVKRVLPAIWVHGHYHVPLSLETYVNPATGFGSEPHLVKSYGLSKDDQQFSTAMMMLEDLSFWWIERVF